MENRPKSKQDERREGLGLGENTKNISLQAGYTIGHDRQATTKIFKNLQTNKNNRKEKKTQCADTHTKTTRTQFESPC